MRKQYDLSQSIFSKRSAIVARIPNFWSLVLEQAPEDIDQFIQPQDSRVFAESLINIEVRRPELDVKGSGNPRSVSIKFDFKPNEYFEDTVLEKTFWHRRAKDGVTGLVSEPVKIRWKEGRDLTEGLTDGAVALWEARKKVGDMMATGVSEYAPLKKLVESYNEMNTSFFTWFGWISGKRYISAEESEKANEEHAAQKERRSKTGEGGPPLVLPSDEAPALVETELADDDDQAVEVHQEGEGLAVAIAEDLWPNAIKYFTQAQELDELSDVDFEEAEDEDDEDEEKPVDIRSLVGEGKGSGRDSSTSGAQGPPSKRQKK